MEPQPVTIEQVRECKFKKKPDNKRGCATCGLPKAHEHHMGVPPSLNAVTSRQNPFAYQGALQGWKAVLRRHLDASGLPKPLGRVTVEGLMTFPDRTRRDQGNYRFLIEKALGDVLTDGGWLEDDDWTRYEFGGLAYRYEKGVAATKLEIFPAAREDEPMTVPDPLALFA